MLRKDVDHDRLAGPKGAVADAVRIRALRSAGHDRLAADAVPPKQGLVDRAPHALCRQRRPSQPQFAVPSGMRPPNEITGHAHGGNRGALDRAQVRDLVRPLDCALRTEGTLDHAQSYARALEPARRTEREHRGHVHTLDARALQQRHNPGRQTPPF